jgi:hypothetical protein
MKRIILLTLIIVGCSNDNNSSLPNQNRPAPNRTSDVCVGLSLLTEASSQISEDELIKKFILLRVKNLFLDDEKILNCLNNKYSVACVSGHCLIKEN